MFSCSFFKENKLYTKIIILSHLFLFSEALFGIIPAFYLWEFYIKITCLLDKGTIFCVYNHYFLPGAYAEKIKKM